MVRFGQLAQPAGQLAQDREGDARLLAHDRLEVPCGEGKAGRRLGADDLGDPGQAVDDRELSEELARAELGERLAVADHAHGARGDDEEAGADLALAGDHSSGRYVDLGDPVGDPPQTLGTHPGEETGLGQELGRAFAAEGHRSSIVLEGAMLRRAAGAVNTGRLPRRARVWHHASMVGREELVDAIAGFTLFADLTDPQLAGIVHTFEEAVFAEGERVLRQGLTGSGFYVVLDGEAAVVIDGTERARLARGDFFGEVSIVLGESPIADVVALRPLRCLVLAGPRVEGFLIDHPRVMYRMLQVQARRLRAANRWRS